MKPLTPMLYSRSPLNPVRPTIAPEVIVEHVSAKANWNKKNARNAMPVAVALRSPRFELSRKPNR